MWRWMSGRVDGRVDVKVHEWEHEGEGGCAWEGGCGGEGQQVNGKGDHLLRGYSDEWEDEGEMCDNDCGGQTVTIRHTL